jgi:hypothetical protein
MFTMRLSEEERRRLMALRGRIEQEEGVRISLADVLRRGLECLETKRKAPARGEHDGA